MIKDGRPYTNENGNIDDKLLTDLNAADVKKVGAWIAQNILPSTEEFLASSYHLKQLLQEDTQIYLTNNQFKDAMLLAGYQPINSNDLNWYYNIILTRQLNDNRNPFFLWVKRQVDAGELDTYFTRDMLEDFTFPVFANDMIILQYLISRGANQETQDDFKNLWERYCKEVGDENPN